MKSWKYVSMAVAILSASLWASTINITVGAPAPGTPVQGVKVVLINAVNQAHLDSVTSAANGTCSFLNVVTGSYAITASLSGYNSNRVSQVTSSSTPTYSLNISITLNNSTGVFTGMVRHGSDSTPFVRATVNLTGGPIDPGANKTVLTDSTGHYRFDSVYAGTGYTITASATNYLSAGISSQAVAWNNTATVGTLYLTQSLALSLHGTIRRTDSTTKVVVGAKVMVVSGTTKIDSLITDSIGNYNFTGPHAVNAGTYTLKVSAPLYKSNTGTATQDTAGIAILFGQNLAVNVNLTPAQHGASGTVNAQTAGGLPLAGVKVVMARRTSQFGTYVSLDSTTTDSFGFFAFGNMIAATGGTTGGQYQFTMSKTGYGTANNNSNSRVVTNLTTPTGADLASILAVPVQYLVLTTPIMPSISDRSHGLHIATMGDHLALDLGVSNTSRTVSIFSLNGSLQHRVNVPAGESRAVVPGVFAPTNGFLFQVK